MVLLENHFGSYPAEAFDSQGRFWANSITFIGNDEKTNNVYAEINTQMLHLST